MSAGALDSDRRAEDVGSGDAGRRGECVEVRDRVVDGRCRARSNAVRAGVVTRMPSDSHDLVGADASRCG